MSAMRHIAAAVAAICLYGISTAQVRVSALFDSGSVGIWSVSDTTRINLGGDSLSVAGIYVQSRPDPANPVDTAITRSSRWYHFRIEGVADKLTVIRIDSSEVVRPFYSYDGEIWRRFASGECFDERTVGRIFESDTVYVAYFIPYTYSRHLAMAQRWSRSPYVRRSVIGHSTQGLPLDMFEISDGAVSPEGKKKIWIHARVHPSEAPCSWLLEKMVEELISDTPFATSLRRNAVFYIVPMTNPDGVRGGYSRSTSTGVNIEVNWNRPDSLTEPEIIALKTAIDSLSTPAPLSLILNLHSQIANSASYWIHTEESTSGEYHRREALLSALTESHSPFYRPQDRQFSKINVKYVEGRTWEATGGATVAITFETPYTYFNEDARSEWVSEENLGGLARSVMLAAADLFGLDDGRIVSVALHRRDSGRWRTSAGPGEIFFGDSYLEAQKKGAGYSFVFPRVPAGQYVIYKWDVNAAQWLAAGNVTQKKEGRLRWRYRAAGSGDKLNAAVLVKEQSNQ